MWDCSEMKCALCGHEFTQEEALCNSACPLADGCPVVCCPRCGYQTVDESRSILARLARRAGGLARKMGSQGRREPV
jgi:hypothetical protein